MTSPRDTDLSGCPMAWNAVPLLPPQGERVAVLDGQGYRASYRVKLHGQWFLVRFLPAGVSATDARGFTRVLLDLEELEHLARRLKPVEAKPKSHVKSNRPTPMF